MKLLKNQYQDVLEVLSDLKISEERLSLIKRKGKIQLRIEGIDGYFEFFRRKSTSLTSEDHQWQKSEHYELNIEGQTAMISDWDQVISYLKTWLNSPQR